MPRLKKLLTAASVFGFLPAFVLAQNFIEQDSALNIGVELIRGTDQENAKFIRVKKRRGLVTYTPDDWKGNE